MTNAMVQGAVLLKRSPIPDMMVSLTGYGLEGYKRVNTAFGVEEKIVHAGQKAVSAGITATGIFANAAIRAGLAYQMAPGRREKETAMQMLAIKEAEKAAAAAGNQPVKIVRVIADSLPGGIPPPQLVDAGTQTDWPIDQYIPTTLSTRSGKGGNSPQRGTLDASADPGDGTVRGVLASYLDSSLRVAGNVVTAGSEAVLGKERTLVLMGVDPIEARRIARQPAKQVKTDEKDDGLLPEDGNVVYVNVGGTLFATTLETLTTAYPDSLLAEWFGDEAKRASLELRDGCYFVDRDATHFRHIINYLRGLPSHLSLSRTPPALLELALEAEFYRLPDLASQLHDMYEDALLNPIAQLDDDQIEEKGWRDVAGLVRGVVGLAWRIGKGRLRRRRGVVVAVVNAAVVGVVLAALWVY
ncbi:uncharacterized protein EV422DRAFT_515485 [Fimicolochytrium jonesii]|uniref:uncharacterized protein n=1 Tax=Fimicolochytrium jonesii TaxID=1396493 RepID=UPI0022FF1E21|nr:uncharacterized protein EV422DRAFT_515485 [Fimicolochytrium jonesii]KAI8826139.1 hypothetical protein EV422DRAFT_515485 [Fimicolochytrium jonesii]